MNKTISLLYRLAKMSEDEREKFLLNLTPEQSATLLDALVNRLAAKTEKQIEKITARKPAAVRKFEAENKPVRRGRRVGSGKSN